MSEKVYMVADKRDFESKASSVNAVIEEVELVPTEDELELIVYIRYEANEYRFMKQFKFEAPSNKRVENIDTYPGIPDKFRLYAKLKNDDAPIMIDESISENIKETIEGYFPEVEVTLCYRTPPGK